MINIGIGIGWAKALYSVANNVIANFKARVATYPGSIFEAGPCLDATLEELNSIGLLDNASLVITPNAYNETKLYDVIPNTTLGDMDVVRATTATRVNSAGLIEVVPRNLFQYSEAISTSPWALVRATVSTNSINSPTGTLTADTLVSNITGSDGSWTRQIVSAINGNFNMSIYAKQGTSPFLQVRLDGLGAVIFNLSNGTVKLSSSGIIGSITSVGSDGWYRCSISGTATGQTTALFIVGNSSMNLTTWFATNGDSVYLWGAQLDLGTTATEYFPTTTRLNIPRIDYTNGSCPSLLVEPQRTNLATYSEQFDNSAWTLASLNATVTANNVISPDGTQNADRVVFGLNGYLYQQKAITGWSSATLSIYSKTTTQKIVFGGATPAGTDAYSSINVGNGWFRQILTRTFTSGGTGNIQILPFGSNETLYFWGAQVEQGSYPTSYIPTVASTVTRNADSISKTGISSLIGQTEGTLFCEINLPNPLSNGGKIIVGIGTSPNRIYIAKEGSTTNFFQLATQSASGFNFINSSVITTSKVKFAIAYKGSNNAFYINGSLISSASATANPTSFSNLLIGDTSPETNTNIKINSVQLYKTRLTNAELQSLTTL